MKLQPLTGPLPTLETRREWKWSSSRKILTGENRRNWREIFPTTTFSITNRPLTVLGTNPDLRVSSILVVAVRVGAVRLCL